MAGRDIKFLWWWCSKYIRHICSRIYVIPDSVQLIICIIIIYSPTLRWLDKLGVAAVIGHKRVFRQDFVGGNYALLDADQNPLPVS